MGYENIKLLELGLDSDKHRDVKIRNWNLTELSDSFESKNQFVSFSANKTLAVQEPEKGLLCAAWSANLVTTSACLEKLKN